MMTIFVSKNSAAIEGNPRNRERLYLRFPSDALGLVLHPATTATLGDLQDNSALVDEQQPTIVQPRHDIDGSPNTSLRKRI